jgi:hypothetical protein
MATQSSIELTINLFILPLVSSIGFMLNLLCVVVYYKLKKCSANSSGDLLYNYLFVNSISNSIAMFLDTLGPIALCASHCQISQTYLAQIYYLYGFIYLADVFETYSSLIDLIISIDRYAKLENRLKFIRQISHRVLLVGLFILCLLYYIPFVLKKEIKQTVTSANNETRSELHIVYTSSVSDFGRTKFGQVFVLIQLIFSELLVLVIMITFNGLLAFSLYKQNCRAVAAMAAETHELANADGVEERKDESSSSRVNNNEFKVTLMIITMSIINFIGNSPIVIIYTISIFYRIDVKLKSNLAALSNLFCVISFACYIFVYYYFNINFRVTLNSMLFYCFKKCPFK